jgi:hypothetical protein
MSGSSPHQDVASRLVPKRPPGRGSRKARAFADEIGRLQALGYSLEAIREALAEAGVVVSKSTVQREAARQGMARAVPATPAVAAAQAQRPESHHETTTPEPPALTANDAANQAEGPSGNDIAEAYMRSQITNPLIRAKERR